MKIIRKRAAPRVYIGHVGEDGKVTAVCFVCGKPSPYAYGTPLCPQHTDEHSEMGLAREYALACILYYGHDVSIMPDTAFDALTRRLLKDRTFERIPWVEEELLSAGSGYDLTIFPPDLHELANRIAGSMKELA